MTTVKSIVQSASSVATKAKRAGIQWIYNRHAVTLSKPGSNEFLSLLTAGVPTPSTASLSEFVQVQSIFNEFVQFRPVSGNKLLSLQYSQYPFANRMIAANSCQVNPLEMQIDMFVDLNTTGITDILNSLGISMPSTGALVSYKLILPFMQALIQKLKTHQLDGGMFTLCVPSQIYFNCLLQEVSDISETEDGAPGGLAYRLTFIKPLISSSDATATLNSLANAVSSGGKA